MKLVDKILRHLGYYKLPVEFTVNCSSDLARNRLKVDKLRDTLYGRLCYYSGLYAQKEIMEKQIKEANL